MTVCIAALAENGKKVIIAADNMLSHPMGDGQYQQEDDDHKKVIKLTDETYVLTAGRLYVVGAVIGMLKDAISPASMPEEIARIARGVLQKFALEKIEEEILKKQNLDWNFWRENQTKLSPDVIRDINHQINRYHPDIHMLIVGYDAAKCEGHISSVHGSGILLDLTLQGFSTNGSGGDPARYSMLFSNYKKSMSSAKVQQIVKKAMSDAKKAYGVGDIGEFIILPQ